MPHALTALRLSSLVAVLFSAMLAVDYVLPTATFCGGGGGCAAARASDVAAQVQAVTGVALPIWGLIAFLALLGASLTDPEGPLRQKALPALALSAGLGGLGLLGVQALSLGQFCKLCVVVDLAAVVAAAAAAAALWRAAPQREVLRWWSWTTLAGLAVAGPLVWPQLAPPDAPPPGVLALHRPGALNVVEFADFECPHCRKLHTKLKGLLQPYGERVHFVRRHHPMDFHPEARGAALAHLCADAQGQGEPMADKLFAAEDLSPPAARRLAVGLGVDPARYDACVADPATAATVAEHKALLATSGLRGVPVTFVGYRTVLGNQPEEVFRDALERAARGEGAPSPALPWLYAAGFVLLGVGAAWKGRVRPT